MQRRFESKLPRRVENCDGTYLAKYKGTPITIILFMTGRCHEHTIKNLVPVMVVA